MKNPKGKLTCSYLYADGHAVLIYEQKVKVGGSEMDIEYAVIHEKFTNAHCAFKGRICISRYEGQALLDLFKKARLIEADEASADRGSGNTRRMGIAVGGLSISFHDGSYLTWTTMPNLISSNHTYQPNHTEAFDPDACSWGNCKVAEIKRSSVTISADGQTIQTQIAA